MTTDEKLDAVSKIFEKMTQNPHYQATFEERRALDEVIALYETQEIPLTVH